MEDRAMWCQFADPAAVTVIGGVLIGVLSGTWRSLMLGWLFGLLVGVVYGFMQTRATPKHLRRLRFTQFVGSGRFGSAHRQDSRVFDVFLLGIVGLIAELVGLGLFKLVALLW
jgi:hypothetical protein